MNTSSTLPYDFGTSWDDFVRTWCLGTQIKYSQAETIRALETLKRLWPEDIAELVNRRARGATIIVSKIELGCLLADCEEVNGFPPVFERLKIGERSAYSELVLVSSLLNLGYKTSFAPPLKGKILDAKCKVEKQTVYFEVVTPEQSKSNTELQKLITKLPHQLTKYISACRLEVELLHEPSPDEIQTIIDTSQVINNGEWVTIGSVARIRKISSQQTLKTSFDGDGAQIKLAGDTEVKGDSTSVLVRCETNDDRAKRIFDGEYHHFSKQVANVLVVNVTAVIDGFSHWEKLMSRRLQPAQNRKVGAVILFNQCITGFPERVQRNWKVIINTHAHIEVSKFLVEGNMSLNES